MIEYVQLLTKIMTAGVWRSADRPMERQMADNRKNKNTRLLTVVPPEKGGRVAGMFRYVGGRVKNTALNLLLIGCILAAMYMEADHRQYSRFAVQTSELKDGEDSNQYCAFRDGVVKYNKDGVSFILKGTQEQWIQPSQMKSPAISVRGNSFAVYDVGGNTILVFERSGLKGEIKTTLPVEKLSVSGQGIVAALLKNQSDPVLMVYDAVGNVLAKQKINALTEGYPTAMTLSADGRQLVVAYAGLTNGKVQSVTRLYSFSDSASVQSEENTPQMKFETQGLVGDVAMFSDGSIAVVGEADFYLYRRGELDKEPKHITFDSSINSICYDDSRIGFLIRDTSTGNSLFYMYDSTGREIFSRTCKDVYDRVELIRGQLFFKGETQAAIMSVYGEYKFEGDLKDSIITIMPGRWLNRYDWFNKKGYRSIRLQ